MATHARVINTTNGCSLRLSRAHRAVRNCAAAWVEFGVTIRNLTIAESIQANNEQAKLREPLPYAEVHGLRFDPPASGLDAYRREGKLLFDASQFAHAAAAEPRMAGL